MTYTVSKSPRDVKKAMVGTLKDNAKLYELLEKYDEKINA